MALPKWILGGLGFVLGGPIGALVGVLIGSAFERGLQGNSLGAGDDSTQSSSSRQTASAGDIKISLLVLMASVIKADGQVLKSEISYIKPVLVQIYGEDGAKEALQLLKQLLEKDIDHEAVARQIAQHVNYSTRLELVHLLIDLANADGQIANEEERVIESIARNLHLSTADYQSLIAPYRKTKDANWAYKTLEIESTASDEEVKKAYRRMAMKYHPDKVANAGEEIKQQATNKFRSINEAYEHIKMVRGMK